MPPAPEGDSETDRSRDPDGGRDRDGTGRARNARPRDGLGRPLDRGAAGEPTVPDEAALSPAEALEAAQRLLDAGRPFHAHEVLEASWKAAPAAERDLWQGLAQLAVGLTHALRGNAAGAVTLLRRGADRITRYQAATQHGAGQHGATQHGATQHGAGQHGIDSAELAADATGLAAWIDRDGLAGLTAADLRLQLRVARPPDEAGLARPRSRIQDGPGSGSRPGC